MRATYGVLALLCAGCSIGPRAAHHLLALGPAGVPVEIELTSGPGPEHPQVSGELLAVTDSGFWILADNHPRWVAFADIYDAAFNESGDGDFSGPGAPPRKKLKRLRLESRFPQGITPAVLEKLQRAYEDTAPRANRFLDSARAATEKYRDVSRALADGYRPVGPGTPAMGQHWVNIGILIGGKVDPAAPAILEYTVADRDSPPTLVGVAYAMLLSGREEPPAAPVPASWWHAHRGTLDAEALSASHSGMDMGEGDRVAVLHAWIWLPNPAGDYEAENWLLPLASWVRGF